MCQKYKTGCRYCEYSIRKHPNSDLFCIKNKVPIQEDDYCEQFERITV